MEFQIANISDLSKQIKLDEKIQYEQNKIRKFKEVFLRIPNILNQEHEFSKQIDNIKSFFKIYMNSISEENQIGKLTTNICEDIIGIYKKLQSYGQERQYNSKNNQFLEIDLQEIKQKSKKIINRLSIFSDEIIQHNYKFITLISEAQFYYLPSESQIKSYNQQFVNKDLQEIKALEENIKNKEIELTLKENEIMIDTNKINIIFQQLKSVKDQIKTLQKNLHIQKEFLQTQEQKEISIVHGRFLQKKAIIDAEIIQFQIQNNIQGDIYNEIYDGFNLVFLLDRSNSAKDQFNKLSILENTYQKLISFLEIRRNICPLNYSIIVYDDFVDQVVNNQDIQNFDESEKRDLQLRLYKFKPRGGTAFDKAFLAALDKVQYSKDQFLTVFVLLTDGKGEGYEFTLNLLKSLRVQKRNQILLYVIAISKEQTKPSYNQESLRYLATACNGDDFFYVKQQKKSYVNKVEYQEIKLGFIGLEELLQEKISNRVTLRIIELIQELEIAQQTYRDEMDQIIFRYDCKNKQFKQQFNEENNQLNLQLQNLQKQQIELIKKNGILDLYRNPVLLKIKTDLDFLKENQNQLIQKNKENQNINSIAQNKMLEIFNQTAGDLALNPELSSQILLDLEELMELFESFDIINNYTSQTHKAFNQIFNQIQIFKFPEFNDIDIGFQDLIPPELQTARLKSDQFEDRELFFRIINYLNPSIDIEILKISQFYMPLDMPNIDKFIKQCLQTDQDQNQYQLYQISEKTRIDWLQKNPEIKNKSDKLYIQWQNLKNQLKNMEKDEEGYRKKKNDVQNIKNNYDRQNNLQPYSRQNFEKILTQVLENLLLIFENSNYQLRERNMESSFQSALNQVQKNIKQIIEPFYFAQVN